MKSIFNCLALVFVLFLYNCSPIDEPTSGKIVIVSIPGTLDSLLATTDKLTVTKLTLKGIIDARDVKYLRDSLPSLADLDLNAVTIAAYTGKEGPMGAIPYEYTANGLPDAAFEKFMRDSTTLKKIVLPSTLTSIGIAALSYCTGLTLMSIPESVTSIANGAFADCSGLKSINIPSKVTIIEQNVFRNCMGLTTITIPHSVTTINNYAFAGCTSLKSITIPNSVTTIRPYVFTGCKSLTSVNIPESVTLIGVNMFVGCTSLETISVDTSSKYLSSVDGVLFSKDKTILLCCPAARIETYTVSTNVTTIEYGAFSGCSGLKSIVIPDNVTSIKSYAFQGCTNLTSIYAYPVKPVDLRYSSLPFDKMNISNCTLYVPVGSKSLYQTATEWKKFANIVEK